MYDDINDETLTEIVHYNHLYAQQNLILILNDN